MNFRRKRSFGSRILTGVVAGCAVGVDDCKQCVTTRWYRTHITHISESQISWTNGWCLISSGLDAEILSRCVLITLEFHYSGALLSRHAMTRPGRYIQSLLSTALLQFFLAHKFHVAAARCCAHGACFNEDQFHQIYPQLPENQQPVWLGQLLNVNARDLRLDTVHFLLHLGADTETVHHDTTALMRAAAGGHEAVVRMLLEHGANVEKADDHGTTALMRAALGGQEKVVQLLLDHGAEVGPTVHLPGRDG